VRERLGARKVLIALFFPLKSNLLNMTMPNLELADQIGCSQVSLPDGNDREIERSSKGRVDAEVHPSARSGHASNIAEFPKNRGV